MTIKYLDTEGLRDFLYHEARAAEPPSPAPPRTLTPDRSLPRSPHWRRAALA